MIEFRGISVQTRTLLLAGAAVVAIVILWPDDDRKSAADTATQPERAAAYRERPMPRFQERPQWRQPSFDQPHNPQTYPGGTNPYATMPPAGQTPHYPQQPGPHVGYRFRQPTEEEKYPSTQPSPYPDQAQNWKPPYQQHTPQNLGPQFRPLEKARKETRRYSGGNPETKYHEPATVYPPSGSVPETPYQFSDPYATPWEYPMYQDYSRSTVPANKGVYPGY